MILSLILTAMNNKVTQFREILRSVHTMQTIILPYGPSHLLCRLQLIFESVQAISPAVFYLHLSNFPKLFKVAPSGRPNAHKL